jgi:hypothetical protein
MTQLTAWQRLVAENYGGGDYAHVQSVDECRDVGDTLFTFLMVELDPKEDCDDWPEALRRIGEAQRQIEEIYNLVLMHAPYLTARGKADFEAGQ